MTPEPEVRDKVNSIKIVFDHISAEFLNSLSWQGSRAARADSKRHGSECRLNPGSNRDVWRDCKVPSLNLRPLPPDIVRGGGIER